ncbi:MAG: NAD-dependent dihydroorotate dehydrogenase B electron transfer subunit [Candidatus Zixiibacteriota bacterium]|nr:MAG: NAD-dependent dihydroorotate dehydrogenase B electron transfer subunit [candidate division Zixibacteria bacterium]
MSKIVVENVKIIKKKSLGRGNFIFEMAPFSKTKSIKPGQFVHIRQPRTNLLFRRAFSVYDFDAANRTLSIIFKVFGRGTSLMAKLERGAALDVMGPLGNGFKYPSKRKTVILAAGGIGMPPLYLLAKTLLSRGYDPDRILYFYGGSSKADLVDISRIKKLGIRVYPSTDDGSYGFKGFVTDAITDNVDLTNGKHHLYGCGPEGMLKALDELALSKNLPGQLSLEAPMPCGIGICLGCIKPLRAGGYTRICREGPVYDVGEVLL